MANKSYTTRNSFNTGEISPLFAFRDDVAKYKSACLILENGVPLVEGGVKKMPGTYFAGASGNGGSMFTGSIAGTTLTVTAVNYGVIQNGQTIVGVGISAGTVVLAGAVNSGWVSGIGTSFTTSFVSSSHAPQITIVITGDGSGATAYVWFQASGGYPNITWTPHFILNGGSGYTAATATVTVVFGNAYYPSGVTVYTCSISSTTGGTGIGGVGTYTVNNSQTVASEMMQTVSSGKSRLVPFQFSTTQGAILEFSANMIRIWEGASQGFWSLGLALQNPTENNYDPLVAYIPTNVVLVGPWAAIYKYGHLTSGILYVAAPYGTSNANTVPITVTTNTSDVLSVTITGSSPNQGINIALSNATAAHNGYFLIETAIRALVSLNSPANNFVDLSAWTVTPDTVYFTTPWIAAPGYPPGHTSFLLTQAPVISLCTTANVNDQFPVVFATLSWNTPYWSDGSQIATTPIEVHTPYAEADLFALDCSTQSADVLWVFHTSYPPAVIERLGANNWQYSLSLPGLAANEAPYRGTTDVVQTGYSALGQAITAISNANPCVVTVASTAISFGAGTRVYINLVAGMVEVNQGEYLVGTTSVGSGTFSFSLIDPNTLANVDSTGYLAYTSGGFAVQVVALFGTSGNYPACGTLYQERLCVGGTLNNPVQMNGSVQDDYPDFITDPNQEDYAIQFTLVSNRLDQILNMIGTPNALLIGTSGGSWIMAGTNGGSLSQTSVVASKQSNQGVSPLQPQLVNDSAIFVSRSTRIVNFMVYNFVSNQWDNYDLTRLNRQITLGPNEVQSGIIQTAFQMEPYPIYWAVRADGQLIGLVFNKQDQVYAWFRINMQTFGGNVESVAVISGAGQEDQVVVVVNRTVNGVVQRFVEYFMPQELFSLLSNAFFVHSGQQWQGLPLVNITAIANGAGCQVTAPNHGFSNGMLVRIQNVVGMSYQASGPGGTYTVSYINQDYTEAYTVAAATTNTFQLLGMDSTAWSAYISGGTAIQVTNVVTGLSYLIGNTVTAVGDGAVILQNTLVTSDSITFPYYYNLLTIGIPYTLTIQPTDPALESESTTTVGMRQKLSRVTMSLYESMGGMSGTELGYMYPIDYGLGQRLNQPSMTTADITRDMDDEWDDNSTFIVVHNDPLPFTLKGLVFRMVVVQD